MNAAGIPCVISLILAGKCGTKDPVIDVALARGIKFIQAYTGLGGIPYGDHSPTTYDSNGKSSMAAVAFDLVGDRGLGHVAFQDLTGQLHSPRGWPHRPLLQHDVGSAGQRPAGQRGPVGPSAPVAADPRSRSVVGMAASPASPTPAAADLETTNTASGTAPGPGAGAVLPAPQALHHRTATQPRPANQRPLCRDDHRSGAGGLQPEEPGRTDRGPEIVVAGREIGLRPGTGRPG